ncbi:hypothetical protein DPMN_024726 [Dreissena polymorpha]|uniref:Uncharacterized protein n=1 Tax=Dreissena polymorpha TaxID=45954 RepID=A0A9D4LRX2_DREPO|nr:hypothetical protein DPMN_024726 [Dreissena polymorpha]
MAQQEPTRNFGWARPMFVGPLEMFIVPMDLLINLKEDRHQAAFINGPGVVMWTWMVEIDRVVIRDFQGSSANSVGTDRKRRSIQYPLDFKNIISIKLLTKFGEDWM